MNLSLTLINGLGKSQKVLVYQKYDEVSFVQSRCIYKQPLLHYEKFGQFGILGEHGCVAMPVR